MQIRSAHDFFSKLLLEQEESLRALTDHRVAINAAMTAWHLWEWAWNEIDDDWALIQKAFRDEPLSSFRDAASFQQWVVDKCPAMRDMEAIAVGAKHKADTLLEDHQGDFDPRDFNREDFDVSRVRVRLEGGFDSGFSSGFQTVRREDFDRLLDVVVVWWSRYFERIQRAQGGSSPSPP
ncbi:MAG: hypothetical protein PVG83_01130 [Acidimicrobiia bacterium]